MHERIVGVLVEETKPSCRPDSTATTLTDHHIGRTHTSSLSTSNLSLPLHSSEHPAARNKTMLLKQHHLNIVGLNQASYLASYMKGQEHIVADSVSVCGVCQCV